VKNVTTKRNAVEDDAEEQDDDRNDGELDVAQAKEADKRKDRDDSGKEDKEKDAQDEEEREAMKQRVTANNCDGARRDYKLGDITDKEEEERNTGSGGDEMTARENDGDSEERRKRPLETCEAFNCLTPGDRPNKRSKGDDSESEDTAATDDLTRRTFSPRTTPRPRTPSPTFIAASPSSAITIVRQTSAVPRLEDTGNAV
jgi:hypothetical protein